MIKIESAQVTRLSNQLRSSARDFPKSASRVISTVQRGAKTEATKAATAIYGIGRNRLASEWRVSNVETSTLSFILYGFRKPISLMQYGARQTARGISVAVLKGARKLIGGGFIENSPAGVKLPWKRTGEPARAMRAGNYRGKVREPIKPLFGPSPADMLDNKKVSAPLIKNALDRMQKELLRVIDRELSKRG